MPAASRGLPRIAGRNASHPFHVVKLFNRALERFLRTQWRLHSGLRQSAHERWLGGARLLLLTAGERHSPQQRQVLAALERENAPLSNGRLEGLNSQVRPGLAPLVRLSFGAAVALIYLRGGGLELELPLR